MLVVDLLDDVGYRHGKGEPRPEQRRELAGKEAELFGAEAEPDDVGDAEGKRAER